MTMLAISRFLVGFGAGNRSVCRPNVAAMTTSAQRLKYINLLAAVVFVGYALTPGLGSLGALVDANVLVIHLNKYTSSGVILVGFNLATNVAMLTVFDETVGKQDGPPETPRAQDASDALDDPTSLPSRIVRLGAVVFIFLNFNARGILSVFETVNIPLYLEFTDRDPSSTEAVVAASNFQFYLGVLGLDSYVGIEYFRARISDITWLYIGFGTLLMGTFVLVLAPHTLSFMHRTMAELLVWSVGCPITTAVVVAAFSKLLDGRPQGALMGLLGSAASGSRIILPLLPAAIPSMTTVFWIDVLLCATSMLTLAWYTRLVAMVRRRQVNQLPPDVTIDDNPSAKLLMTSSSST